MAEFIHIREVFLQSYIHHGLVTLLCFSISHLKEGWMYPLYVSHKATAKLPYEKIDETSSLNMVNEQKPARGGHWVK
jgi:hypothetical protein